jgi:DNA polymerase elongation subunit (family B)
MAGEMKILNEELQRIDEAHFIKDLKSKIGNFFSKHSKLRINQYMPLRNKLKKEIKKHRIIIESQSKLLQKIIEHRMFDKDLGELLKALSKFKLDVITTSVSSLVDLFREHVVIISHDDTPRAVKDLNTIFHTLFNYFSYINKISLFIHKISRDKSFIASFDNTTQHDTKYFENNKKIIQKFINDYMKSKLSVNTKKSKDGDYVRSIRNLMKDFIQVSLASSTESEHFRNMLDAHQSNMKNPKMFTFG